MRKPGETGLNLHHPHRVLALGAAADAVLAEPDDVLAWLYPVRRLRVVGNTAHISSSSVECVVVVVLHYT